MSRRGKADLWSDAFLRQYEEYLPRVLNYMRLRVDEEALAQDLAAQTFERALSRLHTLRDEGAFGGWLFAIARTVVAGHYRQLKSRATQVCRQQPLSLESAADCRVADCPAPDGSVESQVVRSEELRALGDALAALQEREREIIRLKFVAGLTNRAIGREMGLREGNVAVILYRALRKVRRALSE